jgi:hypothetical protein
MTENRTQKATPVSEQDRDEFLRELEEFCARFGYEPEDVLQFIETEKVPEYQPHLDKKFPTRLRSSFGKVLRDLKNRPSEKQIRELRDALDTKLKAEIELLVACKGESIRPHLQDAVWSGQIARRSSARVANLMVNLSLSPRDCSVLIGGLEDALEFAECREQLFDFHVNDKLAREILRHGKGTALQRYKEACKAMGLIDGEGKLRRSTKNAELITIEYCALVNDKPSRVLANPFLASLSPQPPIETLRILTRRHGFKNVNACRVFLQEQKQRIMVKLEEMGDAVEKHIYKEWLDALNRLPHSSKTWEPPWQK